MSQRDQLNQYIQQVRTRLRLDAGVRGAAVIAATALVATVVLTLVLNHYAFPATGLTPARLVLLGVVVAAICFGLAWPLWRLTWRRSVGRAEQGHPEFEQRLVTFTEREASATSPQDAMFLELLAGDTLKVSNQAQPETLVPQNRLALLLGVCVVCAGVLVWMIAARPGFMGYGASLLWTGPHKDIPAIYQIKVLPGNAAVRRNSDEMVTAQVIGLTTNKVNLFAKYASSSKWEPVAMQPQMGSSGFQFLFAGLPENVEYYVEAGAAKSEHFKFRVVDLPSVKQIQVTYNYPKWTGMKTVSEEHAGDLRALEGTDAVLTVTMSSPLKDGMLVLDDGQPVKLTAGENNQYHGTVHMTQDGAYHVAATDEGQQVRLSEDYFIATDKANPPSVAISRPGGDYRASPIEEVTVGVKAGADFGLTHLSLHYSVNGGAEQTVNVLKAAGAKDMDGSTTLNLEDFKLQPGDVISVYATAKDAHAETKTDMSFIQVDPFEREFSQSQSDGGGGGGGGGGGKQNNQTDIARREKELIEQTFKQSYDKKSSGEQQQAQAKMLSAAQAALKDQARALSMRMQSRDLSQANDEFNSFDKDMETAATNMQPAADKLKAMQWQDALPIEQKVLQALLRAEATFRQIQVAFGNRGGGGGGGGGSAGRDLASLFDLEMDTEKNQYETAQTGSPAEQQAEKVDDALAKLDALAKRQEELAQKQNTEQQTFQQRWQQEMLRREAEQLQKQMEQMQGQQGQGQQSAQSGQQGQQGGQQGQQGQQSQSAQGGQSGSHAGGQQSRSSQGGGQQSASTKDGGADPRVSQALERLRAANEEMKRAGSQQGQSAQQTAEEAKRAADRLHEATDLLGGAQSQQANGQLDALGRASDRLQKEEGSQSDRVKKLAQQGEAMAAKSQQGQMPSATEMASAEKERQSLADARQQMSNDLEQLQKGLRKAAKDLAPTQPGAASSLREAMSGIDQKDLTNLVQRTADWLRQGVNPNSNGTEGEIASGLKKLNDQVHQAQQAAGGGAPGQQSGRRGQQPGSQVAAIDQLDKLRSQLDSLSPGQRPGQNGQQQGQGVQNGQQQGRNGQPGQSGQQSLQRGQGGQQQGQGQGQQGQQPGQNGQGGQQGQGQQAGGRGGNQAGGQQGGRGGDRGQRNGQNGGDIANGPLRGGGGDGVNLNIDTGGQTYGSTRNPNAPQIGPKPEDRQHIIEQGMDTISQLRQMAKGNPVTQKEIDELASEMQKLDPARFQGNPAMVEELHTKVMNDVDKLELELRRNPNDVQLGQVRTATQPGIPAGYQDAVAEYYRRLGKAQ